MFATTNAVNRPITAHKNNTELVRTEGSDTLRQFGSAHLARIGKHLVNVALDKFGTDFLTLKPKYRRVKNLTYTDANGNTYVLFRSHLHGHIGAYAGFRYKHIDWVVKVYLNKGNRH